MAEKLSKMASPNMVGEIRPKKTFNVFGNLSN